MEYRIEFREEAQQDLLQAFWWYEKQQRGLGDKFLSEIEFGIKYLRKYPEAFPEKSKGFREFNLKTFPYIMIYLLDIPKVTVFAVFHTRLNPEKKP